MADQIKQISNGTYGIGALSNGVPIASTDADTQYVVKDIHVQDNELLDLGATLDFVVNGVNAGNIDSSVSGSEIIDVSSTAVAQTSASFNNESFEILFPSNAVNAKIYTYNNKFVNEVLSYATAPTQSAAITTALTNPLEIRGFATIGSNFYYWIQTDSTGSVLYRRAGGINGTETVVPNISNNMPVVFDGVDKFYWVTTGEIYTHNATTNTNSFVSLILDGNWASAISSNPRISYANGLVFWTSTTNGGLASQNAIFAINPTTGHILNIRNSVGTLGVVTGDDTVLEVFYSNNTYYIVSTPDTATTRDLFVRTIPDFGPLTSALPFRFATTVYTGAGAYDQELDLGQSWPAVDNTANKFLFMSSATDGGSYRYVYKNFDPITQTFGRSLEFDVSAFDPRGTALTLKLFNYRLVDDSANKTNATFYPQTATLRVTGVETTL